jgi:hypothetical protein
MFVRQKRIPTILAQALVIGLDRHSYLPLLPVKDSRSETSFLAERFITDGKLLDHAFE